MRSREWLKEAPMSTVPVTQKKNAISTRPDRCFFPSASFPPTPTPPTETPFPLLCPQPALPQPRSRPVTVPMDAAQGVRYEPPALTVPMPSRARPVVLLDSRRENRHHVNLPIHLLVSPPCQLPYMSVLYRPGR